MRQLSPPHSQPINLTRHDRDRFTTPLSWPWGGGAGIHNPGACKIRDTHCENFALAPLRGHSHNGFQVAWGVNLR